jgi:hypothetical protein
MKNRKITIFGLFLLVVLAAPVFAVDLYNEPFTSSTGAMVIVNNGAGAKWAWSSTCSQDTAAGHTTAGTLRWGDTGNCAFYTYDTSTPDTASTPSVATTGCTGNYKLTFNYNLNYQESYWEQAYIDVNGKCLANWAGYGCTPSTVTLLNDNTWHAVSVDLVAFLGSTPATVVVKAYAFTYDNAGNSAGGFRLDDIIVSCDQGGGPGPCATQASVDKIEAKEDALKTQVTGIDTKVTSLQTQMGTLLSQLTSILSALTALDTKITNIQNLVTALSDMELGQALLNCGCNPNLYLLEPTGHGKAIIAFVEAGLGAAMASRDVTVAPKLADAQCFVDWAKMYQTMGMYKNACRSISSAYQLLNGHKKDELCLHKCDYPNPDENPD